MNKWTTIGRFEVHECAHVGDDLLAIDSLGRIYSFKLGSYITRDGHPITLQSVYDDMMNQEVAARNESNNGA